MKNIGEKKKLLLLTGCFILLLVLVAGILMGGNKDSKNKTNQKNNTEVTKENDAETQTQHVSDEAVATEEAVQEPSEENKIEDVTIPAVQPEETPVTPVPVAYPETEGPRKAYLTFDDGTSEQTDRILDILAQYGVKATFFVTARNGEENAARYRRIVAEGHSIGLHSVTHNYKQIYASLDAYIADVEGIRQFVLATTGVDSHLYRFPGGSSNSVASIPMEDCIRYLNQNGYRYFDWNIDTSDSVNKEQSVDKVVSRALGEAIDKYHNCVILMHDSASQAHTVAALPQIIEGIQARGMEILPITENTPLVQHRKAASVQ